MDCFDLPEFEEENLLIPDVPELAGAGASRGGGGEGGDPVSCSDMFRFLQSLPGVMGLELNSEEWDRITPLLCSISPAEINALLSRHQATTARTNAVRLSLQAEAEQDGGPIATVMQRLESYLASSGETLFDQFARWGPDAVGSIECGEVSQRLQDLTPIHQLGYSRSQWRAIQKQLDVSGSGRISNQELIELMRRYSIRANEPARKRQREQEAQTLFGEVIGAAGKEMARQGGAAGGDFYAAYGEWQAAGSGGGGGARKANSPGWLN